MRINRETMFMRIANIVSERSTCSRLKVGAVLVKDSRIISTGYNGASKGLTHCDDSGCEMENGSCIRTVHAETNVIAFAAKNGITTDGAILYTTHAPCYSCAKLLVNAGISKVVFENEYRIKKGLRLLEECGVHIHEYVDEDSKNGKSI